MLVVPIAVVLLFEAALPVVYYPVPSGEKLDSVKKPINFVSPQFLYDVVSSPGLACCLLLLFLI